MPRHEATHNTNTNTKEGKMRQDILTAWKCGDRSFDEVVEITGLTPYQVAYYLPVGIGRIK